MAWIRDGQFPSIGTIGDRRLGSATRLNEPSFGNEMSGPPALCARREPLRYVRRWLLTRDGADRCPNERNAPWSLAERFEGLCIRGDDDRYYCSEVCAQVGLEVDFDKVANLR